MQAEMLKYRHTAIGKLTVLMPVICVVMSAVLTHVYFTIDSYNWCSGQRYYQREREKAG